MPPTTSRRPRADRPPPGRRRGPGKREHYGQGRRGHRRADRGRRRRTDPGRRSARRPSARSSTARPRPGGSVGRGAGPGPGPAGCAPCRPASSAARRPRRASGPRSSRARSASGTARAGGRPPRARSPRRRRAPRRTSALASGLPPATAAAEAAASTRRSRIRRRIAIARARAATRTVTPYSQLPTDSLLRIAPARRASTRNTAWNASCASPGSSRTLRQIPSTIGPCRVTRASNARSPPSSRLVRNRSSSSPSVIPAQVPEPKRVASWSVSPCVDLSAMPSPRPFALRLIHSYSAHGARRPIQFFARGPKFRDLACSDSAFVKELDCGERRAKSGDASP